MQGNWHCPNQNGTIIFGLLNGYCRCFHSRFRQISIRQIIALVSASSNRVSSGEKNHSVTAKTAGKTVIEDSRCFSLFSSSHRPCKSFCSNLSKSVIQVIFHRLFRNSKCQRNCFMRVARCPAFTGTFVRDSRTFRFYRSFPESSHQDFFFKGPIRVLNLKERLLLFIN